MSTRTSSSSLPLDENPTGKVFAGAKAATQRHALGNITNSAAPAGIVSHKPKRTARPSTTVEALRTTSSSSVGSISVRSRRSTAASTSSVRLETDDSLSRAIAAVQAGDRANPNRVADYVDDIMKCAKAEEGVKAPASNYMDRQTDVTAKMRGILVDWLVEVHLKFKLTPETLYLAINIIDRFLEKKSLVRQRLQLLGVTAMLLASKYEEVYAPEVRDFVYITDKAYTRAEILAMETAILSTLNFQMTVPTVYVFVQRFLKVASADSRTTHLTNYYVERTLQEYPMLKHLPSAVAASAVYLALRATGRGVWTPVLQHYTGYTETALRTCVTELHGVLAGASSTSLQAVRKKYSSHKYEEVAGIPLPSL